MAYTFTLPDVGEGLTEAEILSWRVDVGDRVEINDLIVEIETAKSAVELPAPVAGVVEKLHVSEGQTVPVGTIIITIDDVNNDAGKDISTKNAPDDTPAVLVGPGPSQAAQRRRRLPSRNAVPQGVTTSQNIAVSSTKALSHNISDVTEVQNSSNGIALAAPPVRLLARQLGVDMEKLAASLGRIITRDDIRAAVQSSQAVLPRSGEIRTPIKGIRKATAAAMTASAFTAPHVTEWLAVDMTATMDFIATLKPDQRFTDMRITPLLLVAKAVLLAVREYPGINATWDEAHQEIVQYNHVNLGIATATERGLVVPNIKDADQMNLPTLAKALMNLIDTARAGKSTPADMSGGTITITNIGAFGVDAGTPILNPGEAAIIAVGRIKPTPWAVDDAVVVRRVAQLAISFDHRLVDGELGSRFLATIGALLADPRQAMVYAA